MKNLTEKKCVPCEGGVSPLNENEAAQLLVSVKDWTLNKDTQTLTREFQFTNFYRVMAFVNAVAWIANQENHHPDIEMGYNYCRVHYKTHAINGLSENDFICAAKINQLL